MKMKLLNKNSIACVYGFYIDNKKCEGVISYPKENKIVFILSTLYGCPVKCKFCDASIDYKGKIEKHIILEQFNMLYNTLNTDILKHKRLKIQFSRMGEPAYNVEVIYAIKHIIDTIKGPITFSVSSVVPLNTANFFNKLIDILKIYNDFQIQFSIHSTDISQRYNFISKNIELFDSIVKLGYRIRKHINRKITLNFALFDGVIIDEKILKKYFSTQDYLLKFTPVNPTYNALKNNISITDNMIKWKKYENIIKRCMDAGYEIIESIGDFRENQVKSNCGQFVYTEQD